MCLDESMSGEPMALKVVNKINGKLKFLYRKNKILTPELRRMLCNALIQPHFDYACTAWYPNRTEKAKKKIQIMQNKCIQFCHRLDNMQHISLAEFRSTNWLPTKERVHQCINAITFKFVNKNCPFYLNEIFGNSFCLGYYWNITMRPAIITDLARVGVYHIQLYCQERLNCFV